MNSEDEDGKKLVIARDGITEYLPGSICLSFIREVSARRIEEIINTIGGQLQEGFRYTSPALVIIVPEGKDEELVDSYNALPEVAHACLNTLSEL